jgi:hypothetical protein
MTARRWFAVLLGAALCLQGGQAAFAQGKKASARFATLEGMAPETAQARALAWLKQATGNDAAKVAQFNRIWNQADRPVIDRLADTFSLGNAAAARLLADARNPATPAPTAVPELLRDAKQPAFFRANMGLAYARALSNRRVHEEALDILKAFDADQVADPAAYLFHRAISEHALLSKTEAVQSLNRLIHEAVDSPERYKTIAALMLLDMQSWKEKDLGAVARKMSNIERRLELARGGPQTQKLQKEVISRLDELIKELENKQKECSGCNGGSCPNGGEQQGQAQGSAGGPAQKNPMQDSRLATNGGKGDVTHRNARHIAERWGTLPPQDRAQAEREFEELVSSMSLAHQEAYRAYFQRLQEQATRGAPR